MIISYLVDNKDEFTIEEQHLLINFADDSDLNILVR